MNAHTFPIDRAIECFVHGFCFTRSIAHPYVPRRVGRAWVMRDGPRTSGGYRNEEWVVNAAAGGSPAEVDRLVRRHARGRFEVSAVAPAGWDLDGLRDAYKALGYRLITTEPLMVHSLRRVPRCAAPLPIRRVTAQPLADRLAKAARRRQLLPEHFADDSPLWQYVTLAGEDAADSDATRARASAHGETNGQTPVGWVRSVLTGDGSAWCSNLHVQPAFRRRRIARAMMCRMLRDDRARGAKRSVLLASHAGAKMYPALGYEQVGTLLLFVPRRRR